MPKTLRARFRLDPAHTGAAAGFTDRRRIMGVVLVAIEIGFDLVGG
jgi:hypothetical protein